MLHMVCCIWCATYGVLHMVCCIWCAAYGVLHVVCYIWYAAYGVLHMACYIWCAAYGMLHMVYYISRNIKILLYKTLLRPIHMGQKHGCYISKMKIVLAFLSVKSPGELWPGD